MRRLILNIHLAIGLVAGLFVIVLGATGGILAFEPELDRVFHPHISYIKPGGRTLSLVEIGDMVSQKYPGEGIVAYLPSSEANFSTQVILSRGIISINQYTGEILGVRARGQTFLGTVRALHIRLAMGDIGRDMVKWSSMLTLVSLLTGLYLWWPVKRVRIGGAWWSARFWYDLHSSMGFFSLLPVLVLATTGAILGFQDQVAWFIDKVSTSKTINKDQSIPSPRPEPEKAQITPDQAVAIAIAQLRGTVPYRIQMPRYGGFYVVSLEYPHHRLIGAGDSFTLDPGSGEIVSAHLSSDLSSRARFMAANGAIHDGSIWGVPGRIIAALVSILLPLQAVSGLLIWLRRKGFLRSR